MARGVDHARGSRRGRARAGLVLAGLGLGCSSPSGSATDGKIASPPVTPGSEPEERGCQPVTSRGVWARLDDEACGWELREDGDALALHGLAPEAPAPARGDAPPACLDRMCVYHGAVTVVGPVVLAVVPSHESEMPSDVLVGLAHEQQLTFVSLWDGAGDSVQTDFTRVGPAHVLAPFECGDALALLTVERIPGHGHEPPQSLRAREGTVDPAAPQEPTGAVEREGCRPVALPVP